VVDIHHPVVGILPAVVHIQPQNRAVLVGHNTVDSDLENFKVKKSINTHK
jgi:hypothetical protein